MLRPTVEIHHSRTPAVIAVRGIAAVAGVRSICGIKSRELANLTVAAFLPRVVETDVVAEIELLGVGDSDIAEG
jgi:hypothetical protein